MPENNPAQPNEQPSVSSASDPATLPADGKPGYVQDLLEHQKNSVSREEYDKLVADNAALVKIVLNGGERSQEKPIEDKDIAELRKDLFGSNVSNLSNLEMATKTLQLRKGLMERGEQDPFLPVGHGKTPDEIEIRAAEKVADVIQQCIDESKGSSEVFTALITNRMNDPRLPIKPYRR